MARSLCLEQGSGWAASGHGLVFAGEAGEDGEETKNLFTILGRDIGFEEEKGALRMHGAVIVEYEATKAVFERHRSGAV